MRAQKENMNEEWTQNDLNRSQTFLNGSLVLKLFTNEPLGQK